MKPLPGLPLLVFLSAFALHSRAEAQDAAKALKDLDQLSATEVQLVCHEFPSNSSECEEARRILSDARAFAPKAKACEQPGCDLKTFDALIVERTRLLYRIASLGQATKLPLPWVAAWLFAHAANNKLLGNESVAVKEDLLSLRDKTAALEETTSLLESRLDLGALLPEAGFQEALESLGIEQDKAFEDFQLVSLNIDHLSPNPAAPLILEYRRLANGIAAHLARLRDRLIALQIRFSLEASPRLETLLMLRGEDKAPAAKRPALPQTIKSLSSAKNPFGPLAEEPGIFAGASQVQPKGHDKKAANNSSTVPPRPRLAVLAPAQPAPSPKPLPQIVSRWLARHEDKLGLILGHERIHELGLSYTVGDPGGRAGLVHKQKGPTCAVVSQQEILIAYGALSAAHPEETEARLAKEAVQNGFFLGTLGTPDAYMGDILLKKGLLISKHAGASAEELDEAVKSGKILLVKVDSGFLWGRVDFAGMGHAIVITGAEVSKASGKVLGYYINDSGVPSGGGLFIRAEDFRKAWHRIFIEVR